MRLPALALALIAVCAAAWAGWLGSGHLSGKSSVLDRFEAALVDLRLTLRGPRSAPRDVVIVAIDDVTVAREGGYPLERGRLAELVEAIAEGGARALAVDLLLIDRSLDDFALARALETVPAVVAGAGVYPAGHRASSALPAPPEMLLPAPAITKSAKVGLVNLATDAGGTPRHVPAVFVTPEGPQPSFALRAASLFAGQTPHLSASGLALGAHLQPLDLGWHLALNPYGPRQTFTTISASALLDGPADAALNGRLVVLGATALGVGDRFSTAYDPILPGAEVQASAIANLLDGSGLRRDGAVRRADVIALATLVLAGLAALTLLPALHGVVLSAALLAGWLIVVAVLFGQGVWLSGALPLAGALPPLIGAALMRMAYDKRAARQDAEAHAALGRFQSPALAARIARDPAFLRTPVTAEAAILFVDLAGFTGLSERLGPAGTRDFLRGFHEMVVETCDRHGGIVLSFMGDGAMLGFGLLGDGAASAAPALHCGFELARAVQSRPQANALRVGVNFGPVVLSRLGHEQQQHVAATGDTVNVASRLAELCKDHDAAIAASAALLGALPPGETGLPGPDLTARVPIRGRAEALDAAFWRLAGAGPAAQTQSGRLP